MTDEKNTTAQATEDTAAAHKRPAPYDYDRDAANAEPAQEGAQPAQSEAEEAPAEKQPKAEKHEKETKHAADLAAAKTKAEQFEAQLKNAKDTLLRTAAEYDNFRKRSAREHDAAFANGVSHAVEQLLPVMDTLALAAGTQTTDDNFKKGVILTLDQCQKSLEALGVSEIEALDQPFDPNLHAAVMQQPAPEGKESGTVLQVLQKGYRMGDKVIRHTTVIVAE